MNSITNDEKQLLFDHSFGLTSHSQSVEAETLISSNKEAAEIYGHLQALLASLKSLIPKPCPDELAERTISRLVDMADSGHQDLEGLLADEQARPIAVKVGFWRNVSEMIAVAAAVMIIAGVLLPIFNRERQRYWKVCCQKQLSSIFGGLSNYVGDHDGQAPTVTAGANRQWNTQSLYLPMKLGYIRDSSYFVCPGRDTGRVLRFDISKVADYDDFPKRGYITYSPRKRCPDSDMKRGLCDGPILSDRNPIFDNDGPDETFKKRLDEAIMRANSRNHRGRGQNVLYSDGSVRFIKIRLVANDDIFALSDGMCHGDELSEREVLPTHEADIFLAP